MLETAKIFEEAAAIIRSQVPHNNNLWMKGISKSCMVAKAKTLVENVHYLEMTGRTRRTTWPRNSKDAERTKYLMGYQIRNPLDDGEILSSYHYCFTLTYYQKSLLPHHWSKNQQQMMSLTWIILMKNLLTLGKFKHFIEIRIKFSLLFT